MNARAATEYWIAALAPRAKLGSLGGMTVEGAKIIDYDVNLSLDPVGQSCIRNVALLIEGRLRRQSRWRSQAWRPAAAACNRRLGRQGTPPARHYDLAARSIALRMRRKCRKLKRGPGPKSPRWSAERRASPRHGGAGAFAKAPRRARLWHVAGARHAPERLSALRHPSIGVEARSFKPRAQMRRGNESCRAECAAGIQRVVRAGLFDIVSSPPAAPTRCG